MTTFEAVTTFSKEGYEQYGKRMVRTFSQFWPTEIALHVYAEWQLGFHRQLPEWQRKFAAGASDEAKGKTPRGYNYRFDAAKFSHKVGAIIDAYERCESEALIWIDADTVTHAPVPFEFIDGLFPDGAQVAWLDRAMLYPECGFVIYRAGDPQLQALFARWRKMHETGDLFSLKEWHDSWVFEYLVKEAVLKPHSLSGAGFKTHHPFVNSPLAAYLDHMKGPRKAEGRSRKSDVKVARTEAYWQ